ncbi:aromatic ring-hydroxylating oxygenase subunit alpha [Actinomycetospora termitidis]|uniref:Aromatic ring-hydroxylating dioxygenase subunit alpha n=1 Tax=Actinomycetospora termitidis TaxID=3053470 RepID=A0ABT7MGH1_9PSEU|nr:aromatic ring-hydroxylating dioxygenase subunit alpha [Actinomycetospora sp. Odt1-22]MDL5159766.1 aromatic ring-hydroxylating dioxygenase subunit alpha [Actinomycetospora sp. Odt1-22]
MSETDLRPPFLPADDDPAWEVVREPGLSLPQAAYTDPEVYRADLERIFHAGWLFATHSCEVRDPGQYVTVTVGRESVIVVRDRSGELRAHHNVCAHRGSRITTDERGCAKLLVCPYHQWTYDLDGRLRSARLMGEDFARAEHRLVPVAVREVAGLVFLCLADDPPPIDRFVADLVPQLGPHRLDATRVLARDHYRVRANWKTLVENNRECYHCRGNHPEFSLSNFEYGTHGDVRVDPRYDAAVDAAHRRWESLGLAPREVSFPGGSWYRISRLPLRPGFVTESLDGRPVAPLLGDLTDPDVGSLRLVGLPNLWAHANGDYAMTTRLTPVDAATTDVEVTFLVRDDAPADLDPDAVAAVWRATSEQDWELCENNAAGIASRGYRPGPLSTVIEGSVGAFLDWYVEAMFRPGGRSRRRAG